MQKAAEKLENSSQETEIGRVLLRQNAVTAPILIIHYQQLKFS